MRLLTLESAQDACVPADTTGMANHITEVISRDLKLNIRSINFSSLANGCIGGTVSVEVPSQVRVTLAEGELSCRVEGTHV